MSPYHNAKLAPLSESGISGLDMYLSIFYFLCLYEKEESKTQNLLPVLRVQALDVRPVRVGPLLGEPERAKGGVGRINQVPRETRVFRG